MLSAKRLAAPNSWLYGESLAHTIVQRLNEEAESAFVLDHWIENQGLFPISTFRWKQALRRRSASVQRRWLILRRL